jgi:AcrR family transcriptional regulator
MTDRSPSDQIVTPELHTPPAMPTETLSPAAARRERERQERRDAMLGAARVVFAEKGYEGATLDEVAERAGFGKGTLYNYFPGGKEAILLALMDHVFGSLNTLAEAHFAETEGRPVRERFERFIAKLLAHFTERRDVFRLLMKEGQQMVLGDSGPDLDEVRRRRDEAFGVLTAALERAMEAGELRPFPPKAVAELMMGNVKGYMAYACSPLCDAEHGPPFGTPDEAAAFLASVLFDGLCARPDSTT